MQFQEFPKALYLSGQQLVVEDGEQEDAARADGYDDWHADQARTEGGADQDEAPAELDRDALKARAAELGVDFARNVSTEKLAELVAAAEQK